MIKQVEASTSLVPLSTFLFKLILTFFSVKLFGFLFISPGHDRPDPTPETTHHHVTSLSLCRSEPFLYIDRGLSNTRTVTVRIIHVTIRTDRKDLNMAYSP